MTDRDPTQNDANAALAVLQRRLAALEREVSVRDQRTHEYIYAVGRAADQAASGPAALGRSQRAFRRGELTGYLRALDLLEPRPDTLIGEIERTLGRFAVEDGD